MGETRKANSVKTESDRVVDPVVGRQRSVAGFVGHAPPASEDDTLPVPVEGPESPLRQATYSRRSTIVLHERLGERVDHPPKLVDYDSGDDVPGDIKKGLSGVFLVKVFGDDRVDFRQGHLDKRGTSELLRSKLLAEERYLGRSERRPEPFLVFRPVSKKREHGRYELVLLSSKGGGKGCYSCTKRRD